MNKNPLARQYTFIGEFGNQKMSYADYLKNDDVRRMVNDTNRLLLPVGLNVLTYDYKWLDEHPKKLEEVKALEYIVKANPLRFFLPSGIGGVDFLNDLESTVKAFVAPNRVGKTASGLVDLLLDVVPTTKEWEVFSQHDVKFREFKGPFDVGVASADWGVVKRVMWPEIKKWIPSYEIEGVSEPSWKSDPHVTLKCGSTIFFYCYKQGQGPFESQALARWYWDEQGEEAKFDGADERLRTLRRTNARHIFGFTPHKVEGRPDTGARSWIQDLVSGKNTKGHKVKVFTIGIPDPPDWVYPEAAKTEAYEKWVTIPRDLHNQKQEREGKARYYGEWHDSAGLVFDEWDDTIHLIDPFQIPDHWTRYRSLDYGSVNPTACLWAAIDPEGYVYFYREYYQSGLTIWENAGNIIRLSGNAVKEKGEKRRKGLIYMLRQEQAIKEQYKKTILDSRSFATGQDGETTIGDQYKFGGLRVSPAPGQNTERLIPALKTLMYVYKDLTNPVTGKKGSPRAFWFRNLENWRRERAEYANKETQGKVGKGISEKPDAKNDHLIDCALYATNLPMKYVTGRWGWYNYDPLNDESEEKVMIDNPFPHDSITGY